MHVFSTSLQDKSKAYFTCQAQKITYARRFFPDFQDVDHVW